MDSSKYSSLEAALGYSFKDQALLHLALTHRSYSSHHNERLEFLGDSVLNCAASILLFETHPDMDEGKMSRVRSHLVKQDCLAMVGRNLLLDQYLFLGAGELRSAKTIKDSIVADALEPQRQWIAPWLSHCCGCCCCCWPAVITARRQRGRQLLAILLLIHCRSDAFDTPP